VFLIGVFFLTGSTIVSNPWRHCNPREGRNLASKSIVNSSHGVDQLIEASEHFLHSFDDNEELRFVLSIIDTVVLEYLSDHRDTTMRQREASICNRINRYEPSEVIGKG